ncbi:MAG: hypothetical protein IT184_08490 [Acidobacteria bacterium]|nr:hypothetical protein [Acidobacteriota bacterium]
MAWLLAACASSWLFAAIAAGTFVPLRHPDELEYLYVWPETTPFLCAGTAATIAMIGAYAGVRRLARGRPEAERAARGGRWLAPATLVALAPLGILPAAPGVGERAALLSYLGYDLRWWWCAALLAWLATRADRLLGSPMRRRIEGIRNWPTPSRRLLLEGTLFAGVLAWTFFSTPLLRLHGTVVGDEPKYLRFCELWYQGGGLDISRLTLVSEQPIDAPPRLLRNLGHAAAVLPEVVRDLAADLPAFVTQPATFRWSRVTADHGFVRGKHGGIYQVHQPGVSLTLMPGYVLDRYLVATTSTDDGKFPREFPLTTLTMWLWAGACAVALFRLLADALCAESLAWVWALVGLCTLPAAAFAFQLYPELPALWIVLTGTRHVLFVRHAALGRRIAMGGAIGALAWFHPRFLLVAACLTAAGAWRLQGRPRAAFVTASAAAVFSLMVFAYHVSGSFLPTALWEANDQSVSFLRVGFVLNLLGYAIDRTWGALPHALILSAGLPGLVLLARSAPAHAWLVATLVLALVVPAAGHTLSAAGTTPGRLIVAVVPLLIWPAAVLVRRWWPHAAVRAATCAALVLSFEAAFTYDWWHTKGPLIAAGASGWRPNLAFPIVRGDVWSHASGNTAAFAAALVALAAGGALAWRRAGPAADAGQPPSARLPAGGASGILAGVAAAWLATAAIGDWTSDAYLLRENASVARAVDGLLDRPRCRICFSTRRAQIDWKHIVPNTAHGAHAVFGVTQRTLRLDVVTDGEAGEPAFLRARVEYGDGEATGWQGVNGRRTIEHQYARPGRYRMILWFETPDGRIGASSYTVEIGAREGGRDV